jgi:hypothetical protein
MSRLAGVPGLKDFMRRGQSIGQYRAFLRQIGRFERGGSGGTSATALEIRTQVHDAFRQHQHERDSTMVRKLLTDGGRQLELLSALADGGGGGGDAAAGVAVASDGSWIDTEDPDDPRGRVGAQWPWQAPQDAADAGANEPPGMLPPMAPPRR